MLNSGVGSGERATVGQNNRRNLDGRIERQKRRGAGVAGAHIGIDPVAGKTDKVRCSFHFQAISRDRVVIDS
jgi:hypothetical protein